MNSDFTSLLEDPFFSAFFQAWDDLRANGKIPHRSDVKLQDFAPFAADLLMYELHSPTDLRSRLIGSSVVERVKFQGSDINWLDLVCPSVRDAGELWWNSLFSTPCAGVMQFSTRFLNGTNRLARAMLLPIIGPDGQTLLLTLNKATAVFRVDDASDTILISADCFQTLYIDVGFGLPAGQPARIDSKPADPEVLTSLYEKG
ncbi:MAG: PAS domain-containing protein [Kordiimonadaceae bacterium]|nr:PAS domain-containing protein [Kordiimonadaceae bacterium]MBO6569412.1 PAS domain-containing protein [Kordiimonadaceae bacterium]MBO6964887.1 PAS domain-containing protein [Kordiimonadaceae bacterium]